MLLDIHLKELALLMSKMGGLSNKNVTCNKILSNFLAIPSGTNVTCNKILSNLLAIPRGTKEVCLLHTLCGFLNEKLTKNQNQGQFQNLHFQAVSM